MAFGRSVEASGSVSGGERSFRPAEDEKAADGGGPVDRNQRVEVKAEMLQRALANMRRKARLDAASCDTWVCSCVAAPAAVSFRSRNPIFSIYPSSLSNSHRQGKGSDLVPFGLLNCRCRAVEA